MADDGGDGGKLKSTSINGVKLYTLASQQPSKKKRARRKDKDNMSKVELVQNLSFDIATSKIKATPDGEFLIASGIYPPQVKVYELGELSLKFKTHFDSEIIDFQILSDDYSKLAFMCADRSIILHAKYGKHYSLRIPRVGRDTEFDPWSGDLLCAASFPDVYRINLQQGRFLPPLNTESPAVNVVSRSKLHGIVACGGEDGAVECFDTRTKSSSIGRIDAVGPTRDKGQEVTALAFDDAGGFQIAVGSSSGKVLIYDLRSSDPIRIKDHMYDSPILDIKWHCTLNSEKPKMITTDKHIVRIWDPDTGEGMTSIEPTLGPINDTCVFKDSGLMLLALNSCQIPPYFLPALGPAPKWCSYLENLTEEMEEQEGVQTTIDENSKFLTKEDLERLNLTHLIGTDDLRALLHGFLIKKKLYEEIKAEADPSAYDAYIEKWKKDKLDKERANRITMKRKLPKVNRRLANQILEDEEAEKEKKDEDENKIKKASKKKKGLNSEIFQDERFAHMFKNENFEIDEFSPEYLALHPMASTKQPSLVEEHFEPLEDSDQSLSDSDASAELEDEPGRDKHKKARGPKLYEVKDERHAEAFWNRVSLANEDRLTMEERVATVGGNKKDSGILNEVKLGPGGSREISFKPRSSSRYKEDDVDEGPRKNSRSTESLDQRGNNSGPRCGMGHGNSRGRGRGRGGGERGGGGGGRGGRGKGRRGGGGRGRR